MRLLIAATSLADLTVSQTCAAPSRQAIFGRGWWAFNGHGATAVVFDQVSSGNT
jgi:hypothetical protein